MAPEEPEPAWRAAASAHLLEARKKYSRLGSKKTKTGCATCKARRIKCDEARPDCERCLKTGRICGYSTAEEKFVLTYQQPQFASLQDDERRQFDFFIAVAAPRLAGPLDKDFWCSHILQLAQTEPFVIDGALAISELYEHPQFLASFYSNPLGTNRLDHRPRLDEYHVDALRHYNKAIRLFTERMSSGDGTPLLALLSCTMFLCIELIRDNIFVALQLYQRGVELSKQLGPGIGTAQDRTVLTMITNLLGRVGALIPSYAHPEIMIDNQDASLEDGFRDVAHARSSIFALIMESSSFAVDVRKFKESLFSCTSPSFEQGEQAEQQENSQSGLATMYGVNFRMVTNTLPPTVRSEGRIISSTFADSLQHLQQRQLELLDRLALWHRAFDDTRHSEVTSYLLMLYHSTLIWTSSQLQFEEVGMDVFTSHFEEVLRHAAVFLDAKAAELPTFTFEVGATPPLFLVAMKCRIPSFRRRALALMLRSPPKECMHGSTSTAEFARRLIEIEEEGLGLPPPHLYDANEPTTIDDTLIPADDKRIRNPELLKTLSTDYYEVKIERRSEAAGLFRVDIDNVLL